MRLSKNIEISANKKFLIILTFVIIFSCLGVYKYVDNKHKKILNDQTTQLNSKINKLELEKKIQKNVILESKSTITKQEEEILKQQKAVAEKEKELSTLKKKLTSLENKKKIPSISRGGNPINAEYLGSFRVTFYTPYDGSSTGRTATGTKAIPGKTVAVDPNVIPLGTRLFVEGLGEVIAEDTGGVIRGNRLDYCVSSRQEAYKLGVKKLKIWIIK